MRGMGGGGGREDFGSPVQRSVHFLLPPPAVMEASSRVRPHQGKTTEAETLSSRPEPGMTRAADPEGETIRPGMVYLDPNQLDKVSPTTRLLEKRRQVVEAQEELEIAREHYKRLQRAFKKRENALKLRDIELMESLVKYDKFLQENENKREMGEKRTKEETKMRMDKETVVEDLAEELETMKRRRDNLYKVVERNLRYKNFLQSVSEVSSDYGETDDVLGRYTTLTDTNKDLLESMTALTLRNEDERLYHQKYIKEKTNEILGFTNRLTELKKELERKVEQKRLVQDVTDGKRLEEAGKNVTLGMITMTCDNLYCRFLQSTANKPEDSWTNEDSDVKVVIQKLQNVDRYVEDVREILYTFVQQAKRQLGHHMPRRETHV